MNRRERAPELGVVVRVAHFVAAIPIASVVRLALAETVRVVRRGGPGAPALVDDAGVDYAGWDLDELLGLPPAAKAWTLLQWTHRNQPIRIALATGPCVSVEQLPDTTRLPRASLGSRSVGVIGAFKPSKVVSPDGEKTFGVVLDPSKLFTRRELDLSAAVVAQEEVP
jgi:hypothetical protein